MATERYLVTGGCGLQGSHIVEKLLSRYPGAPVFVVSRHPDTNRFPGVNYMSGDICSAADVSRVLDAARPSVVFHCAGAMTVGRAPVADDVIRHINVEGTRVLVDECRKRSGDDAPADRRILAFVFTSSASVVQKNGFLDIANADETWPLVEESDGFIVYPTTKVSDFRGYRDFLVLRGPLAISSPYSMHCHPRSPPIPPCN